MNSLPRPDFDPTPYDVVTITNEVAEMMVGAAEDFLLAFQLDGPAAAAPSAMALAQMVKDHLAR